MSGLWQLTHARELRQQKRQESQLNLCVRTLVLRFFYIQDEAAYHFNRFPRRLLPSGGESDDSMPEYSGSLGHALSL